VTRRAGAHASTVERGRGITRPRMPKDIP